DRHGATGVEDPFQHLRPGVAWHQIPAVQKDTQATVREGAGNGLYRRVLAPVVAEKNVIRDASITHRTLSHPLTRGFTSGVSILQTGSWWMQGSEVTSNAMSACRTAFPRFLAQT